MSIYSGQTYFSAAELESPTGPPSLDASEDGCLRGLVSNGAEADEHRRTGASKALSENADWCIAVIFVLFTKFRRCGILCKFTCLCSDLKKVVRCPQGKHTFNRRIDTRYVRGFCRKPRNNAFFQRACFTDLFVGCVKSPRWSIVETSGSSMKHPLLQAADSLQNALFEELAMLSSTIFT